MSSKKWVLVFLVTVLVLAALLAGLNLAVDPFGAFGGQAAVLVLLPRDE